MYKTIYIYYMYIVICSIGVIKYLSAEKVGEKPLKPLMGGGGGVMWHYANKTE